MKLALADRILADVPIPKIQNHIINIFIAEHVFTFIV